MRGKVFERDKGICAICGVDCEWKREWEQGAGFMADGFEQKAAGCFACDYEIIKAKKKIEADK